MTLFSENADVGIGTGEVTQPTTIDAKADTKFAPGGFQSAPIEDAKFGSSDFRSISSSNATEPSPLPKRPKGRLAVGAVLVLCCILIGNGVWSTFFRFAAYGILAADVAEIAAPWDGVVTGTYSAESDSFNQSDVMVTMESLPLQHKIDRLGDELRIAQAELDAQISRLRWAAQDYVDLNTRAVAQHHEAQGKLAEQSELLEQLHRNRRRIESLNNDHAVSNEKRDAAVFRERGQRGKVAELKSSAEFWKSRAELVQGLQDQGYDQLAPQFASIKNLQKEICRLRETLNQGHLRAPFDSVVVRQHVLTGESVKALEPVIEVLQTGTLEVVLYLKQNESDRLKVGDLIDVWVEPSAESIECEVIRIGTRLEKAPAAIERFYWSNEPLLPVYLKPCAPYRKQLSLRLGSIVKW